jgi:hypothetical protein
MCYLLTLSTKYNFGKKFNTNTKGNFTWQKYCTKVTGLNTKLRNIKWEFKHSFQDLPKLMRVLHVKIKCYKAMHTHTHRSDCVHILSYRFQVQGKCKCGKFHGNISIHLLYYFVYLAVITSLWTV